MPKSKKVWLLAAQTEYNYSNKDTRRKSEILLKALEHLPTEIEIWKEAISLEDKVGAKELLKRAVKCIPDSSELWLALAKLEDYEEAKSVLNNAL